MPTNIELAIADAMTMSSYQGPEPIPRIDHVLSAYIRIAGFSNICDAFSSGSADLTSPSTSPSDAAVISAFERALEKHPSPRSKMGSDGAKLVARVRRSYWRSVLLSTGSDDDELTQLLLASSHYRADSSLALLPRSTSPTSPPPPPPKSLRMCKRTGKPCTDACYRSASSTPKDGFEALLGRKNGVQGTPERRQIYLKPQGWVTLYPCPCCGSMVRAKEVLRVLDLEAGDEAEVARQEATDEMAATKAKVERRKARKANPKSTTDTAGEATRRKTKQIKRRTKVKANCVREGGASSSTVVAFDPASPSTSKLYM
ncbi:hypothetical protein FA15DRAFT_695420 [Coprinopsis marcescibilis]|uniref:Uncharacterized protein n=1 Tax=Coprinopsis marcescibilis TaxID=230819 RepID=A0A5C3KRB1_COPMA|nr:hypothetical protein FA15DRAFT_695420 [Coprinopsis marcescibilis]